MPELLNREGARRARYGRLSGVSRQPWTDVLLDPVGSEHVRRGIVQINPQTADCFGFGPGDSVVLNQGGIVWPFRAERFAGVEPGQVRMNRAEMAVMGILNDVPLAAHRATQPAALPHNWPAQKDRHDWMVPMEWL